MACIVLARLANVAFAVGAVYVTYRIGTTIRDRPTGRLAAVLLTVTFGFLVLAHEAGEDVPALFFFLLAFYYTVQYTETGAPRRFLAGCLTGALAIAFKLTAAPIVVVLVVGYALRVHTTGNYRPALGHAKVLVAGGALGAVTIVLCFPSVLVSASFDPLVDRVLGESVGRTYSETGPDAPVWWWFLRGYVNGLGLPLFVGSVVGVLASVRSVGRRTTAAGVTLALVGLGSYLLLFSQWHDFRVHHLLPTFPLLAVVLASSLSRLRVRRPSVARALVACLVLTSGAYAAVGTAGYASQPRDAAVTWLDANASPNATLGVSRNDFQDTAIPHGMAVERFHDDDRAGVDVDPCPTYLQVTRRDLLNLREEFRFGYDPERASYLENLVAGQYNYELVEEFGPRPPAFVPQRPTPGSLSDLVPLGVVPRVDQYGDEQELGPNQYTAILERTGACGL
nr:glycosyltransferase family 39 protein [Halomarina rubra]